MTKRPCLAGAIWLAATPAAMAGGIERTVLNTGILFETGDRLEVGVTGVNPDVGGSLASPVGALSSGDVAGGYANYELSYRGQISPRFAYALTLYDAVGADVDYTGADDLYPLSGATAEIDNVAAAALVQYRQSERLSVYGGLRALKTSGVVDLGAVGYELSTSTERDVGYVVGAAYERPEIALRVALTYASEITQDFDATESVPVEGVGQVDFDTDFATTVPRSVTLDVQSGVAPDTLVFGQVRWVEWTAFDIAPEVYTQDGTAPLVDYDEDTFTYTLGVGRQFTDAFAGALTAVYEPGSDTTSGNLGPTDGRTSLGVAGTYTSGPAEISAGISYVWIGDATTSGIGAEFEDNNALAGGIRFAYNF